MTIEYAPRVVDAPQEVADPRVPLPGHFESGSSGAPPPGTNIPGYTEGEISKTPGHYVDTEIARLPGTPDAEISTDIAPDVLVEVRHYYALLQTDYARRVLEIEVFLGFAESSEALGTRLHKIETFLGIKGV